MRADDEAGNVCYPIPPPRAPLLKLSRTSSGNSMLASAATRAPSTSYALDRCKPSTSW